MNINVTDNAFLLCEADGIDAVIEVTGAVEFGTQVAMRAIQNRKHIIMMNAEVDGTVGPILKVYADKAGVVYQEKCAIAINFFLKIVNNVQYFSPFRTYLQPIFLFSSNLSCIFYRPLTALPFFCGNASPFPLFFQSFLAKQQEKSGKYPLNVPWFCAKFTLSIKCF